MRGFGTNTLRLQLAPLLAIDGITFSADGGASSLTIRHSHTYNTLSRTAALAAFASVGCGHTQATIWAPWPIRLPWDRAPYYTVTYTGGCGGRPSRPEDDARRPDCTYDIEDLHRAGNAALL